ncbi:TPA: 3-oxoacyl-ACP reductase [Candidatus Kaiserbacteria bacterium]|nr:MAG: 3-oxoacyl-(Acyl carrier protein) reductase [Parcubacteria group bacterium GW2011_GWA1_56_13]HCR52271.1 3-oxoacyl-ACP reductase [Candidatus Kaiserbacteria bacterium]
MHTQKSRVVFVTGASRGIGQKVAKMLLVAGYRVACGYRTHKDGALALARTYPEAFPVRSDVKSRASIKKALTATKRRFGKSPDILVNNAGIADERPLESITDAQWDHLLAVNLRGPFIVVQEALPAMRAQKWGRIVNIVSIGGQWGGMRQVHYAAAKAGLINFTRSLAKLYSREGITSNAVSPGLVETDMSKKEMRSKAGKQKAAQIPIGRLTKPEEIAAAVMFLISDDAASITGQTLNVNGGMLFS